MNNAEIKPSDASAPVENGWTGMQGPVEAPAAETLAPAPAAMQATEVIAPAAETLAPAPAETIAPVQEAPAATVQTAEIAGTPMGAAASISESELVAAATAAEAVPAPAPEPEQMPVQEPASAQEQVSAPTPEPEQTPVQEPALTQEQISAPTQEVEKAPVAMTANEATGNQEKVASQSYDFIDAQGLVHHCTSYEDMQQQIADAREAWHDLMGN